MSLIAIHFTFLEGRDGEIVVKELEVVDSSNNRVSSYVFKSPYGREEFPPFNARMNQAIDHGCNWNDSDVLYSELETVLRREASSTVPIYCFGPQKAQFISSLIERTVIDVTQLGCPLIADIILRGINCTFALSQQLQTCLCIAGGLLIITVAKIYTLSLQYAKCPTQPAYH